MSCTLPAFDPTALLSPHGDIYAERACGDDVGQTTATTVLSPDAFTLTADAAIASINRRVIGAYTHDLRGSIQAVQGAVELLARLGKVGTADPLRMEKASELAKRAVANHTALMSDVLRRLLGGTAPANALSIPPGRYNRLIQSVLFFLRHEAERVGVELKLDTRTDSAPPAADADQLFVVLTGLLLTAIDSVTTPGSLNVELSEDPDGVCLSIEIGANSAAVIADLAGATTDTRDPVLRFARMFYESINGRLRTEKRTAGTHIVAETRGSAAG